MCKKIIIIGAGLSGLTAGIYAQMAGFDAEIYEKHTIVGGECTGWDRKGYHIDNCIHWLMGCVPGSGLYNIWKNVDAIKDDEVIQYDSMYVTELNGQSITLWKDVERTERELIALSPEDEKAIKDLIKYVRLAQHVEIPCDKPAELMGLKDQLKMMKEQGISLKIFNHYKGKDTQDLMNAFKHPLIRCMISDFVTKESRASSFVMSYGAFIAGNGGVPKGGSRAMSLRMKDKFESLGGKVFTGTSVQKIELDGKGKATGIRLADGTVRTADYIVPACDTDVTFRHLLDESYMDPVLKEMYANPNIYPIYSMFQAAYAVDSAEDVMKHEYILPVGDIKTEHWMGERMTVKNYNYEPSFAPQGKQIVQILLGGSDTAYDFFKALYQDKTAYNQYKETLALKLMEKVEERFPAYKGKMSLLDVWTPMTYVRYCNAYRGYNQAFTPTKYAKAFAYPSPYVKGLNNVVLAGQWLTPPGGCPGAAIQGKYAIMRIMHKEHMKLNF